ncbi:MAG: SAM-dependent methyltransferase [Hyphomicrobiales bacterium]|nr:SAM-dependent methyltransferase [Hyphomicrobiales bacterium]MCP5373292.1 SAM-dependent methyltransferase [Hyphomicrobiales bacterium]
MLVFDVTVLALAVAGSTTSLAYTAITGISPVPSTRRARRRILDCIPRDYDGTIYELGAGWGHLALPLARRFPRARVVAYELSPFPWAAMVLWRALARRRNLTIHRRNFLKHDLTGRPAVIVCYLHTEALVRLRPQMERQLPAGSLVISNAFEVPGWTPEAAHRLDDTMCPYIYVYRVPED